MSELILGWRKDLEDLRSLKAKARTFSASALGAFTAPEEIDHRGWLQIENQGPVGSCAGHAESTCLEVCNYIATGGNVVQLSRMFCYLAGQQMCGLFGADQGSTIEGVVEASKRVGVCLESTFPYPGRYITSVPNSATIEAAQHKLRSHVNIGGYQQGFDFVGSGVGGLIIGIDWVQSLINCTGIVDSLRGGSVGGHALAIVGYSKRLDRQGRKYLWLANSHGRQWGNNGWAEIAPAVFDYWCQRDVVIGVSDLENFGPREIKTYVGMTG